jgi:hypothetical protein
MRIYKKIGRFANPGCTTVHKHKLWCTVVYTVIAVHKFVVPKLAYFCMCLIDIWHTKVTFSDGVWA